MRRRTKSEKNHSLRGAPLIIAAVLTGCSKTSDYTGYYGMVKLPTGEIVMGEVSSYYLPSTGWGFITIGSTEYRISVTDVVITRKINGQTERLEYAD